MSLDKPDLSGLEWVDKLFAAEPRWTREPDLEAIERALEELNYPGTTKVVFLAQGALNKLYEVRIGQQSLVMRVSLPVDPYYKTASEIATVEWIRRTTELPVPRIITSKSTRDNPIGFEWILMTKLPGKPLGDCLQGLPLSTKSTLVRQLAKHSACLFRNQFRGIGNIYTNASNEKPIPDVGRIVSMDFFWGDHIHQNINRGPFSSSRDWIDARIALSEHDCQSTLAKYPDGPSSRDEQSAIDDATRTLDILNKLKPLVSVILPAENDHPEPSILFHDDLSRSNILVNDEGEMTGVLDWECVTALPLWKACFYPSFLDDLSRTSQPDTKRYHHEPDGEISELYWQHLWEYEATVLRGEFIAEMGRLEPSWLEVFNASQIQRDLDAAVQNCDDALFARDIIGWIGDVTSGAENVKSLDERIDGP